MSSNKNKIKLSSYYNKKYAIDEILKLKQRKESQKMLNINNINKMNRNIIKYNHKNNSCNEISDYLTHKIEVKSKKKKSKDEDKLIFKTSLIEENNNSIEEKNMKDKDKYHINFELLANAGINNDININMTFI